MLRPDKHTNLDYSVLNISSFILKRLMIKDVYTYNDLYLKVKDEMSDKALINFPYAINFLYLLGKVEYLDQTDSFILNETK